MFRTNVEVYVDQTPASCRDKCHHNRRQVPTSRYGDCRCCRGAHKCSEHQTPQTIPRNVFLQKRKRIASNDKFLTITKTFPKQKIVEQTKKIVFYMESKTYRGTMRKENED